MEASVGRWLVSRPYDRIREARWTRSEALEDGAIIEAPAEDERDEGGAITGQGFTGQEFGFHEVDLDRSNADVTDSDVGQDDGLGDARGDDELADALDMIAACFNGRDLEQLLTVLAPDGEAPGLLGSDRDNLGQALEDLWQHRPTCQLVRGYHLDEAVGVLFEHDGTTWWPIAAVHVDDVHEGRVGVMAFSVGTALLEEVTVDIPGPDALDEGERWIEWSDGDDGS